MQKRLALFVLIMSIHALAQAGTSIYWQHHKTKIIFEDSDAKGLFEILKISPMEFATGTKKTSPHLQSLFIECITETSNDNHRCTIEVMERPGQTLEISGMRNIFFNYQHTKALKDLLGDSIFESDDKSVVLKCSASNSCFLAYKVDKVVKSEARSKAGCTLF